MEKISYSTKLEESERFTLVIKEITKFLEENKIDPLEIKTYKDIENLKWNCI